MEMVYMKKQDISEEILNGLVEVFFSNRYEYSPNQYYRMSIDESLKNKDKLLKEKIRLDMTQRIQLGFRFFVVIEDGEVIGYNNHYLNEFDPNYVKLEIGTTCVLPKCHGRGIGQMIYAAIEKMWQENKKIKEVLRSTWSTNERQRYLYQKNGYEVIEVLKDHYGVDGIDKMTFSKKMNS